MLGMILRVSDCQLGGIGKKKETYHVIGNDCSMPVIDLDSIHPKDSCHLIDNGRPTCFNTICLEDGVDIGSVEFIEVDKFIG